VVTDWWTLGPTRQHSTYPFPPVLCRRMEGPIRQCVPVISRLRVPSVTD
jgi:hypothetical protein